MAADALSRVFSALADPTRRDMVARLAVADATVNELAEPYDVTAPGRVQAPEGAGGRRPGDAAPGTPNAARSTSKRRSSTS